ncbi:zinc-finger domain-containing protein [Neobacillus sp. MM2021_6]|uniref:zinc-finger domain-containing protein n=1 Tax=Bacillaceae TaxID=186817 RepID=UPI00140CE58C|nr:MULTISPECIES: zinc-finger domain-containing protein [Bacillaceae]MBO0958231.1 zinc-finger domain-containing protein [Neobacillus sp. MM2021_6]NHC17830.1 zinc-finger domain-containing protein [Bacillus sp. MM2020_4]WML40299.1 zinc-finger domain-containing protein [Neobacillus sp. OS1-2]
MKHSVRKQLFSQVESMINQYCDGCFLHQQLKKDGGRRVAHRFCITQCTVGEKLQEYGNKLK